MQMTGEQYVNAARQRVWEALNDPAVLQACIPGCQSLEREADDRFVAIAEVRIGPIGARFKGSVSLSEIDAPNSYVLSGQGNGGVAGSAKGRALVSLADQDGGTKVSWSVDAEVGGRMAQLGGPIIDATARHLAGKFFERFGEVVSSPGSSSLVEAAEFAPVPGASNQRVGGGAPWAWLTLLTVAIIAGYLLSKSDAPYSWVVAVIALAILSFVAGRNSGRNRP